MKVLGIESSCDETSVAIIDEGRVLSHLVASQHDVHRRFGGVVPELASRRHLEVIIPLLRLALDDAKLVSKELDGVAATYAPGLQGALLVGLSAAKGIALAHQLPFIGVNHLEGHLYAPLMTNPSLPFPYVALVVSGGHTNLYEVKRFGEARLLGATRDDAAGEAFDKVAKLLGLGFPGGPKIDQLAQQGNPDAYRFPKPRWKKGPSLDFSFSGIKTAVLLAHRTARERGTLNDRAVADFAASFQRTVIDILLMRLGEALRQTNARALVISGGVAANSELRRRAEALAHQEGYAFALPPPSLCTDNAAMIAYVGERYLKAGKRSPLSLNAVANLEIGA